MLQIGRSYSKSELNVMLGKSSVQALQRKLKRYGVTFHTTGRGEKSKYEILDIDDPFKLFCIIELDFEANADFDKIQYFYYYFFNDDEFAAMPDEEKAQQMSERGCPVTRQTIKRYTQKLERKIWIAKDTENCIYYFVRGNERRIVEKEEYSKAWKEYWHDKDDGLSSEDAIINMRTKYNGVARKQPVPLRNAFYLAKIEEMCNYIQARFEKQFNSK